jgi:DnaJ family protein C protein 7
MQISNQDAIIQALKEQGNSKFEQRAYRDAIQLYSKALAMKKGAPLLGNRAAAWMMVGAYSECIADCREALTLEPNYTKAHIRLAKALCECGEIADAASHLARAAQAQPNSPELEAESRRLQKLQASLDGGRAAYVAGEYLQAVAQFQAAMDLSNSATVQCWMARAQVGLGRCDQANRLMLQLLKTDQANVEACTVRAQALYLSGDFEAALKHLREALRLNPDFLEAQRTFKRARKVKEVVECGRAAAHCREFEKACELFGEALGTLDTERHGAATGNGPTQLSCIL